MKVTAEHVIADIDEIRKYTVNSLAVIDSALHEKGYHAWSTTVANFRSAVDKAAHQAIEELDPN